MPRTKPSQHGKPLGKPLVFGKLQAEVEKHQLKADLKQIVSCISADSDSGQMAQTVQLLGQPQGAQGKRPMNPKSAYLCWDADFRTKDLQKDQWNSRDNAVISREVGRRWHALSAEQKQYWHAESKKDQERYLAECAKAGVQPKVFAHMPGQVGAARSDNEQGGTGQVVRPTQHAARPAPYKRSTAPGGAPNSAAACGTFALRPGAAPKAKQRIARPAAGEKWIAKPNRGTTRPACCLVVGFVVDNAGQLVRLPAPSDQD